VRPKSSGLAGEESKVEAFETFGNLPSQEEIQSSGGGASTTIRSAAEEEIWTIESHVQTPRRAAQEETDLSRRIWEHVDQQPLDPGNVHKV
jgi:hypothetical protein